MSAKCQKRTFGQPSHDGLRTFLSPLDGHDSGLRESLVLAMLSKKSGRALQF
jgi:hypothetical protein